MHFIKSNAAKMIISHLTDIEGNLGYFERWVRRSNYLQFNKQGVLAFSDPQANQKFIYGGDFCDKGPGDLRIGRQLTEFKANYPHKVTLIAGNREIKSRRFTYELNADIRQRLLHGLPAFWNQQSTPQNYLIKQMQSEGAHSTSLDDMERYVSKMSTEACQTLYLKWMLNETMGCGAYQNKRNTYEYRRLELAQMAGLSPQDISDDRVTQSFIDSVSPTGIVTNYLKSAELGEVVGETLFIHGAVTPENMGYVPGMSESQARIPDAKEWIEALNAWYKTQINEWLNNPIDFDLKAPGQKPLDQYVLFNPKSIVTTNWYTQGKLAPISPKVVEFLNRAGIYRVISGHQPFADFPLIIRSPDLEVIVGDTGYSDSEAAEDTRGLAIHNLALIQLNESGYVSIDATFKDSSSATVTLPSHTQVSLGNDTDIGHFTPQGQLIRPLDASQWVGSQLDGFKIINEPIASKRLSF